MRRGRPRTQRALTLRQASLALALTLGAALSPAQTPANDRLIEAWRRQRETAMSRDALPASALTRDLGQIAVIEHDGANYDSELPGGGLNYAARERVGRRFYESHGDDYDFLVVFTNFEFRTGDATAFHLFGRNDVEGIGKLVGSAGSEVFGSRSRLKGWIDMAAIDRYRAGAFGTRPGEAGFIATLNVLAHEVGHQWLAQARFVDGSGRISDDLLGRDGTHWSYLLDSDASLLYGAKWVPDGPGLFHAARVKEQYSALDRYFMGFLPAEKVQPFFLLRNPGIDPRRINREGEDVAGVPEAVSLQQVVAALGPRRPDAVHSQKEFRLGFVFLTRPGTEPSVEDLDAVEQIRRAFGAHFFALTHGIAWADTTLVDAPAGPRAPAPDLERALAWLAAQQRVDGRWQDSLETRVRDTAAAVTALLRAGTATPAWQRGLAWLLAAQPESLDYRARSILAATAGGGALPDREAWLVAILVAQNPDGGFGAGLDFGSDALDTALALRALSALAHPADARVTRAVAALAALASAGGGWPAVAGGEASTIVTAEVLLALLDWREVAGASALQANGLAALLSRQNPDGGFGSSPSTPLATALALDVLLRAGAPGEIVDDATRWLEQSQLSDGSWNGSPHQTALVIGALRASTSANLTVPVAALRVTPSPAPEDEEVQVVARVRNVGRAPAPATVARLFDGPPATSPALGELPVAALAAGAEAEVAFPYPTSGRAGSHTLYVVADAAGTLRESREDDNTASGRLEVTGPLADLEVTPADIVVTPAAPEAGEAAVVSVTVRNRGQRTSTTCVVGVGVGGPDGLTSVLPLATLGPVAAGGAGTLSFSWTPQAAGPHVVRLSADARFQVPESDETNNDVARSVSAVAHAPEGPDLSLVEAWLVPSAIDHLPQVVEVEAVVANAGRAPAVSSLALFDPASGSAAVGSAELRLDARASAVLRLPVTVQQAGARSLRLVADPADAIAEANEGDNARELDLADARTVDVQLVSATQSATQIEIGQTLTVTIEVRNTGTLPVPLVPVQLARELPGGPVELARVDVSIAAGVGQTLSLSWTPLVADEDVPLVVRVDPGGLLSERREDDNALPLRLRVRPSGLPNLSLTGQDIGVTPDPLVEGQPATLTALVHNTGVVASGAFVVRFHLGDPDAGGTLLSEATIDGLGPGVAHTVSTLWSPVNARGAQGLHVLVDALDQVQESSKADNRAYRPFTALGLPDLVLAAADVVLDPGFPRAGDPVSVRATVRNLGGQPSVATSLAVTEGQGASAPVVGVVPVRGLAAGELEEVTLVWSPAQPAGGRPLSLSLDPDHLVVEQDEGNNMVWRTVVVQDADLYLTEPYFSPDGDGVKDETTLAWRAGGKVQVAVADALGRHVRRLVTDGPAEGSSTWDGRDDRGGRAFDGSYTMTLSSASGAPLGRRRVVLDTNRSSLHDASPAQTIVHNLTCALPEGADGPAWMPGGEGALFIVRSAAQGLEPGLLRVALDGSYEYVQRDAFYAGAGFTPGEPVSPDGLRVLVDDSRGVVFVVDLATGVRARLDAGGVVRWSPDSRFVVAGQQVLARDGTLVAGLPASGDWAWSPAGDRLALGGTLVARDGSVLREFPVGEEGGRVYPLWTTWFADGRIATAVSLCDDGVGRDVCLTAHVLDPETGAATDVPWLVGDRPSWSADGLRALRDGQLRAATDGRVLWRLLPAGGVLAADASAGWFSKGAGDVQLPGLVCGDKGSDRFAVTSLANLTAELQVSRLPANNGLLVRGTVADANLERFQLDYARQGEGEAWHPIGPAHDVPIVDDDLASWVPPAPGSYLLRLRVLDKAGNARTRTRVVSWDRVPAIASFTQSDYFLSPNGDGVKDAVTFGFMVLEPTLLRVRVVGPAPEGAGGPAAFERRAERFEYATLGPRSFAWDGRDAAGQVVPDGRYTVLLNELPFRVQVDNTPPDVAYRVDNLRVVTERFKGPVCTTFGALAADVALGAVAGDRSWHAVDVHLRNWTLTGTSGVLDEGSDKIAEFERDASGVPIVGKDGEPRIRHVDGRPADRVDEYAGAPWLARNASLVFEAEDYAGNRSVVPAAPVSEAVFNLGASYRCTPTLVPPVTPEGGADPVQEPTVHPLAPAQVVLAADATLNREFHEQQLRFSYQPKDGGEWRELVMPPRDESSWYLPVASFEALGLDPIRDYRGRFVGSGAAGDVASEAFLFRACEEWLSVSFVPGLPPKVLLGSETREPIADAWITIRQGSTDSRIDLRPLGDGVFGASAFPSCEPVSYSVHAITTSGRTLPEAGMPAACRRFADWPTPASCGSLQLKQVFPYCGGSPDQLHFEVNAAAPTGSRIDLEIVGRAAPPVASVLVTPSTVFPLNVAADVGGEPEGVLQVRGRVDVPAPRPGDPPIEALVEAIVDRTPPRAEVLLPPEGGLTCAAPGPAGESLKLLALARDAPPKLQIAGAEIRQGSAPWSPLRQVCTLASCREGWAATGMPTELVWDSTHVPGGEQQARVGFCDRAGNRSFAERQLTLTRPVTPRILSVSPSPFSPNGDGRADTVVAAVRLAEAAVLTATVHRGSAEGPVVRVLLPGQMQLAADLSVAWDGMADDGQPVADGLYAIRFSAENGCGDATVAAVAVRVDRAPPEVGIVAPAEAQVVRGTMDVRGHVTDEQLASWQLELSCGPATAWTVLAASRNRVEPEGLIDAWDTSGAPPGPCTLRLGAEDSARNRAEALVSVSVERGVFVRQLAATPDLFSPNGDGRRERATVRYDLLREARVSLQVRDGGDHVIRTLVTPTVQPLGAHAVEWDGRGAGGELQADGDYVVWLRAEEPGQAALYEEQPLRVSIDTHPPTLAVSSPAAGGYVASAARVRGSVDDAHLLEFVLSVTSPGGVLAELTRDSRVRREESLASLAALDEGPHTLVLSASDLAENDATVSVPFWIDGTAPRASITFPADGAVLPRGSPPVPVRGRLEEANLESWTLRFGAGDPPLAFGAIGSGATTGDGLSLGAWDVRTLADGPYVLSLVATDRAGVSAESHVVVALDGTPPSVRLASPSDGGYVTAPSPVLGSVTDAHLDAWHLEFAPATAGTPVAWVPITSGAYPLEEGVLGEWASLPPDGRYRLRITARDAVGLSSSATVSVVVDTTPPTVPTALAARLTPADDAHGQVRLTWSPNAEPDLAGYVVDCPALGLHATVTEPSWDDGERLEGTYLYSVVAVDRAGNRSQPATLRVLVDVTPPAVSLSRPADGASVSGGVEVRGTAFSVGDFKDYRLLVGAGEQPGSWTLLQRSTVPVVAGRLGDWMALADGPYRLALEADDTRGNSARTTRRVVVDTVPPAPPVLIRVAGDGAAAGTLRPEWNASPSGDVVGTLVYRNGRLANAVSVVVGSLSSYLVPGTSYDDHGLPDGRHCYVVVALDGSENASAPSNEVCESLENRAPLALIAQPADGSRFGETVQVVATSADLDVERVRFELRPAAQPDWRDLGVMASGAGPASARWEIPLDPQALGLSPGEHALRAVATDGSGHTDPDPPAITITFGDTTPPPAPVELAARVDGADVTLGWTAVAAADVASYRLFRDGRPVAEGLTGTSHVDTGLAFAEYTYTVTAVDRDGNESASSAPAEAVVYGLRLTDPTWPVTGGAAASLRGDGARLQTTVRIRRGDDPVASSPAAVPVFEVAGVPLLAGGNVLAARAEDVAGNRSASSNEVVLISNAPPEPVGSLSATVDGGSVSLQWPAVADPDLFGYLIRRDGRRLTSTVPQTAAASIEADVARSFPEAVFDGRPETLWPDVARSGRWSVHFEQPILVERLTLRFGPEIPTDYTILAFWEGRYLPIVRVRGNTRIAPEHRLPSPFATDSLRLELESPGRVAELGVERLAAVAAGSTSFQDEGVGAGRHAYDVVAVDRYGAEGGSVRATVDVGQVVAPAPPRGLVAIPERPDVSLAWQPNPESAVSEYVVLRDGVRLGASAARWYRDPGLADGTYRYTVIAVGVAGLESEPSAPASVTLGAHPPGAPVLLKPTDAAHPITLAQPRTDVGGRADPGARVTLDVNGEDRGTTTADAAFLSDSTVQLPTGDAVLSADGERMAWSADAETITVRQRGGGDTVFVHGGSWLGVGPAFSRDGRQLAFSRLLQDPVTGVHSDLAVLELATGRVRSLAEASIEALAWSPDGARLAVVAEVYPDRVLQLVEVATGATRELDRTSGFDRRLVFSPDGTRLAALRTWLEGSAELRLFDLTAGGSSLVDARPAVDATAAWSPDGRQLAWTSAEREPLEVRVLDVALGRPGEGIAEAGADARDACFSPRGDWLSFVRVEHAGGVAPTRTVRARRLETGRVLTVGGPESGPAPDGLDWLGERLAVRGGARLQLYAAEPGWFVVAGVALAPGVNSVVARASDPASGLGGPDSEPITIRVPEALFPDLAVDAAGIESLPELPRMGSEAYLRVRLRNVGQADASDVTVAVRVLRPDGGAPVETSRRVALLAAGDSAWVSMPWAPLVVGRHEVRVEIDPEHAIGETSEDDNTASRPVFVVEGDLLVASIASDRPSYPARSPAVVSVRLDNAGPAFAGTARTTVEDMGGREVAVLDEREISADTDHGASWSLTWNTGLTWAGRYAFHVRGRAAGPAAVSAHAETSFEIEPSLSVLARVRPEPVTVAVGLPVAFALTVENHGLNAPLEGATVRLRVQPEGAGGTVPFETLRALPSLLPAGSWSASDSWPAAQPAGRYVVRLDVERAGVVLASAAATTIVEAAGPGLRGDLVLTHEQILAGQSSEAAATLVNVGRAPIADYPVVVEVVSGPEATVRLTASANIALPAGEPRSLRVPLDTAGLEPGRYVVRLRGGGSPATLDRATLVVHGVLGAPSPHAPADGATVATAHPTLVVNDATSPEGAALSYEFELFGDAALTQALPGARGLAETSPRTSWPVLGRLAEDASYWWRARATDGFSTSAWSAVAQFTVDAVNRPPGSPVPDSPLAGATVATRQPTLTVRNGSDPEGRALLYDFLLSTRPDGSDPFAAQAGLAEGPGFTSWTVPVVLDEGATCYWSARARDDAGQSSAWSDPIAFTVDTVNLAPSAPVPLRPLGGASVATATPALVVANASDPEHDPLAYAFEIDTRPTLDSPARQSATGIAEGAGETSWTPAALAENTTHYWRAFASDGVSSTASSVASFFVNATNEEPGVPVPLDPIDDRTIASATPLLRLRNAVDPDGDALRYEIVVRDAGGAIAAATAEIPAGTGETTWVVSPPLTEDASFTWTVRARDAALAGPWSAPAAFQVDAVVEPPTAPQPILPVDGSLVEERRPLLVVRNASSPDHLPLTYAFELDAVAAEGSLSPVDRVEGVVETPDATGFTPSLDLADGAYAWRARAHDPQQSGPWSATARFEVRIDLPPAAPTGLRATPGCASVRLDWNRSGETDVTGYRVYRSLTTGGPYAPVAVVSSPAYLDSGLANGTTYYYVATALDARAESAWSGEAAARPEAPAALALEVRFSPSALKAECLLTSQGAGGATEVTTASSGGSTCPDWLYATLELPPGYDSATIDLASLRLFGSVPADTASSSLVDSDRDGLLERRVRFRFTDVAPRLVPGSNQPTIVGRAGTSEVRGSGPIVVSSLQVTLRVTPRTLQRRSCGNDVEARLTFATGVSAARVSVASVRLNGSVPVKRRVSAVGSVLLLQFDRAAVAGVLPLGAAVEVRVTGTLAGLPFSSSDFIRVIE